MNQPLRELFPVTKNYVYLNHAAVCPISLPVYERMREHARDLLENGFVHFREWGAAVKHVRELAARLINARPDEIAFAPNTSAGLAMINRAASSRTCLTAAPHSRKWTKPFSSRSRACSRIRS